MDAEYIRNTITQLRLKKGVSEHRMSLDLGHGIVSGRTLPSMAEFLSICDYFGITPEQFFHQDNANPVLITELLKESHNLKEEDLLLITTLVKKLSNGYKS